MAAGGTAGHVVPAVAIADELRDRGAEVFFMGARGRLEAQLVPAAGYEIDLLNLTGIDRRNPLKALRAAGLAAAALPGARRILANRGADVVVGGGGFVAGPAGLAARSKRIPLVLTEADRHFGLANRLLARSARKVCLAFSIKGCEGDRFTVTGRAVGRAVLEADREQARHRFSIDPGSQALLIMGGSLGARSINLAAVEALAERPGRNFEVIHVSGSRDFPEVSERLATAVNQSGYTLLEFEPDLGDCLAACDLVLARAGGSVFELTATGRPAVLVPYPHATGDHQSANAEWMTSAGAAVVITDADLNADRLLAEVGAILADRGQLESMAAASRALAMPDAARMIADQIMAAAGKSEPAGDRSGSSEPVGSFPESVE
ncbi:MAG: undecaprenyldiphospho-muramoylpentapeptide beta-N-acetylglucosaminyltransferase [Solirubrobacterales bacterium]